MSIDCIRCTTPQGRTVIRASSLGVVTAEDAARLTASFSPGGSHEGLTLLIATDKNLQLAADSRKVFVEFNRQFAVTTAIVVASTSMRVMLQFIVRAGDALKRANPRAAAAETRFFATEPEALAWLDTWLAQNPLQVEAAAR